MRKVFGFLFIIAFVVLLSGCGAAKTLECSIDQSNLLSGYGTMGSTISADFKGRSLQQMNVKMNIEITSSAINESYMSNFKSILDKVCTDGLSGVKFPKCDVKQDGKKLSLDATVKKSEINDKSGTYGSVEKTKQELEKEGYKCTIK